VRSSSVLVAVLSCLALMAWARAGTLPPDLAVTDPMALRELDLGAASAPRTFGLGAMLGDGSSVPISSDALFRLPAMGPVRLALDAEFARYVARHTAELPLETIGIGPPHDFQLFDAAQLDSGRTRFVLSGIVNRMDRAYLAPESCGEIRLLYRLTRGDGIAPSRLPMTLNMVLRAKSPTDITITCAEIARRWLAVADFRLTGAELASRLLASDGPLASVRPDAIDRIETNLQIAHAPKSAIRDFRTDYLQKVFRYDASAKRFVEAPLENQIDRDRLLVDATLAGEFRAWLLEPEHLIAFDRGTALIPEKFLATSSVAATPAGLAPSRLHPAFGLLQSDGADGRAVFADDEVVTALKNAADRGVILQNIRSPAGFARRLNDISCGGCHQIRGIGGFHFPGVDWLAEKPSNATIVPASPHFVGDQPRRQDILAALRGGKPADFSRGFSDRPQARGSDVLDGSEYLDGWGATCALPAAQADASFTSWSCAERLSCQPVGSGRSSRIGMCFVK
jgi:hypothetical protein